MFRAVCASLVLLAPALGGDEIAPQQAGETPGGVLYRYGAQRVLVARGTPRAMGLAHGRLLQEEVRANVRAFVHEWALGRMDLTREELHAAWSRAAQNVPGRYHEELAGLAEGSGVPLEDLQLLHALLGRHGGTGTSAAALPAATGDGKVYHARSFDYSLDIGDTVRPQTHALVYVAAPEGGVPHATVTWAGFLGCVTGMNGNGVSVAGIVSTSNRGGGDGVPLVFLLREVLWRARDVEDAKEIWRQGPRTGGFNLVFCDPDEACAVECDRERIRFYAPGDDAENVAPHFAVAGIVRRGNHFVDEELARHQRRKYDPRTSAPGSWTAYHGQGALLRERRGRIDAAAMIELLRAHPGPYPSLHQAVLCPGDRVLWVSQARDPAEDMFAGAQNQDFHRYDLRALLAGKPVPARRRGGRRPLGEGAERGTVTSEQRLEGPWGHEPRPFPYELEPLRRIGPVRILRLTFPSPGPSKHVEANTVHAEYYRPPGDGPFPAVVVLHILDRRFFVARVAAATLAQRGLASLFIKMPYYGERRPPQIDLGQVKVHEVVTVFRQGVRDVRRGAAWLRARDEVRKDRICILGVSLGSFLAQLAAGADGGFDRCAFVLGGGSLMDALYSGAKETRRAVRRLEERGWSEERTRALFAPIEPLALASRIRPESVLMVNCRADEIVPPASTRRYWEALGRPRIVWHDGGHYAVIGKIFQVLDEVHAHFAR